MDGNDNYNVEQRTMISSRKDCRNRLVKFSSAAQLRIYKLDLSPSEREACFYQTQEYADFKGDVRVTIEMIENDSIDIDEVRFTARGADHRTAIALRRRNGIRRRSHHAVFEEQDRQWEQQEQDGVYTDLDDDAIAAAYSRQSRTSQRDAHRIAQLDEQEAMKILDHKLRTNSTSCSDSAVVTNNATSTTSRTVIADKKIQCRRQSAVALGDQLPPTRRVYSAAA
jgi:hypothetical protein